MALAIFRHQRNDNRSLPKTRWRFVIKELSRLRYLTRESSPPDFVAGHGGNMGLLRAVYLALRALVLARLSLTVDQSGSADFNRGQAA